MQKYAVGLGAGVVLWFVVGACLIGSDVTLERFAQVGDGLAPFGWLLTAAALLFAFDQHRSSQKSEHLDRLADAYANWFDVARKQQMLMIGAIATMRDEITGGARLGGPDVARPENLVQLVRFNHELAASAIRVFTLERDQELALRLSEIIRPLVPMPPRNREVTLDDLAALRAEVMRRRELLAILMGTTIQRLHAGKRLVMFEAEPDDQSE